MNKPKKDLVGNNPAILQTWGWAEPGWGPNPDGFSIHKDLDALEHYVKRMRAIYPEEWPDIFGFPDDEPYPVGVSDLLAARIQNNDGIKFNFSDFSDFPEEFSPPEDYRSERRSLVYYMAEFAKPGFFKAIDDS